MSEITYQQNGDYLTPNLTIGNTERPISRYGRMRRDLPTAESPNIVQFPDRNRQAVPAPVGNRGHSEQPSGADDSRDDEGRGSDGERSRPATR